MSHHTQTKAEPKANHSVGSRGMDQLIQRLISYAALRAPQSLTERLREEWLADLESRTSAFSRFRFAIGCCWATRVIAYEHRPAIFAAATSAGGPRVLISGFRLRKFSSRSATFLWVLCLHAAVFYLAFTTLSHTFTKPGPAEMDNVPVVTPPRPKGAPLTLPPMDVTRLDEPMPKVPTIRIEDEPPTIDATRSAASEVGDPGQPQRGDGTEVPSHAVNLMAGGPGAGFPNTDEYYPSISRALAEQGVATTQVCVNARGRLTQEPRVTSSTGFNRLDDAALKLAKAGSGHYRANTEDGRAVDSCFAFRIRFQLKK